MPPFQVALANEHRPGGSNQWDAVGKKEARSVEMLILPRFISSAWLASSVVTFVRILCYALVKPVYNSSRCIWSQCDCKSMGISFSRISGQKVSQLWCCGSSDGVHPQPSLDAVIPIFPNGGAYITLLYTPCPPFTLYSTAIQS